VSALVLLWVALIVAAGWRARPARSVGARRIGRRERRRAIASVITQLPDVVDLFALAIGAGRNVTLALDAVSSRAPPAWRPALAEAIERVEAGERVGDALTRLPAQLGEPARPLATALTTSARYGTPLLPVLERLAADARADRRRRAEEAARRLPITLLFPLVLCILPAFALLTLAPAVAGALRSLRL
jgi:tight adherence protein C